MGVVAAWAWLLLLLEACTVTPKGSARYAGADWTSYAGDDSKSRYSTLTQINQQNVSQLKLAWTYRSGDISEKPISTIEC
ncbi:MAG: hypothetical protein ACO1OF_19735, partial [Adhaeribacter sp.]